MGKRKNKKKKKSPEILTDKKGPFYFRTCFIRGKQVREKIRGFVVVDGKPVDRGEYLRANASELELHQMGEYELLYERECLRNGDDFDFRVEPKKRSLDDDGDIPF